MREVNADRVDVGETGAEAVAGRVALEDRDTVTDRVDVIVLVADRVEVLERVEVGLASADFV